jgi:hypothetical protein
MDQLRCISLVLKSIIEESVCHTNLGLLSASLNGVLELFMPHPVAWVLACHDYLVTDQLVNHVNIVDDV